MDYFAMKRLNSYRKLVTYLHGLIETTEDEYGLMDIDWRKGKEERAEMGDYSAWAYIYDREDIIPSLGALVEDIREKGYVADMGYIITITRDIFLSRKLIGEE
jgi:hypothetical protein